MPTTKSGNQPLAQNNTQISAEFPFHPNYIEVYGSKIHYVENLILIASFGDPTTSQYRLLNLF